MRSPVQSLCSTLIMYSIVYILASLYRTFVYVLIWSPLNRRNGVADVCCGTKGAQVAGEPGKGYIGHQG